MNYKSLSEEIVISTNSPLTVNSGHYNKHVFTEFVIFQINLIYFMNIIFFSL